MLVLLYLGLVERCGLEAELSARQATFQPAPLISVWRQPQVMTPRTLPSSGLATFLMVSFMELPPFTSQEPECPATCKRPVRGACPDANPNRRASPPERKTVGTAGICVPQEPCWRDVKPGHPRGRRGLSDAPTLLPAMFIATAPASVQWVAVTGFGRFTHRAYAVAAGRLRDREG